MTFALCKNEVVLVEDLDFNNTQVWIRGFGSLTGSVIEGTSVSVYMYSSVTPTRTVVTLTFFPLVCLRCDDTFLYVTPNKWVVLRDVVPNRKKKKLFPVYHL